MVDTGCLCFAIIDEKLARKNNIFCEFIPSRRLRLADGKQEVRINKIARWKMDIDGRGEQIWGYVMPNLAYPIILGKPWMEINDVTFRAKQRSLCIGTGKNMITVKASGWYERSAPRVIKDRVVHLRPENLLRVSMAELSDCFQKTRRTELSSGNALVGAVSMHDISKALESKKIASPKEVKESLPSEIQRYAYLFLDDVASSEAPLPPHRPGVDTKVKLHKDEQGHDKEVPWGPLYGMSREELLVLRKTLTELLDKNWIRASSSPGGAPVLFIKKPGGGLRFCVDYRALNAISERDRYPLPLIKETMQMLSKSKWLSKVDVRSAFHRLRMAEGEEWKTAFRTRFGSFEWLVTPFGLAGAPAAFQRWINKELGDLLGETCSAYVDDVVIFSDGDLQDHWNKVNQVLDRLAKAGLKLDPNKCDFAKKEIKYLGFIVNVDEGIKVDPEKIRAIAAWEPPKNVKGVRSFLGFANFYRTF
ncbi:hypothetical protein K3495_g15011, partial [Podosphaera aphanis]